MTCGFSSVRVLILTSVLAVAAPFYVNALQFPAQSVMDSSSTDNDELARMYRDDQADRMPPDEQPIDWKVVTPRDKAREARAKELYTANQLRTGADYYHTAMILQHAATPEDYLLAHELCIVAIMKGEKRAGWLAAASEDRFLMSIKRPQRFGTQYRIDQGGPMRVYQVGEGVTDSLRAQFDVPPLTDAKDPAKPSTDTLK